MTVKEMDARIRRFFAGLRQPFRMMIERVTIGRGVKKVTGPGLAGETLRDSELFQQYGLQSCPPDGTMAIAVPLGGTTSHAVIIATEHAAFGVDLQTGEVAIYHKEGHFMHLKNGRIIEAECDEYRIRCKTYSVQASNSSTFDTPTLTTSTSMVVGKNMDVKEHMQAGRFSFEDHVHKCHDGKETTAPVR